MAVGDQNAVVRGLYEDIDLLKQAVGHVQLLHDAVGVHGFVQDKNGAPPDPVDHPRVDVADHLPPLQLDDVAALPADEVHPLCHRLGKGLKTGKIRALRINAQSMEKIPGGAVAVDQLSIAVKHKNAAKNGVKNCPVAIFDPVNTYGKIQCLLVHAVLPP